MNQYMSTKRNLHILLEAARAALRSDLLTHVRVQLAQAYLALYRAQHNRAPASTRRRWRCGY